nr:Gag-Pol polyprotein [Tanacetum cinerariifolium]
VYNRRTKKIMETMNVSFDELSTIAFEQRSSKPGLQRAVLTRNQIRSDGDMCMYALTVSTMEPKHVKVAMTDLAWVESMQEELLQFKRLDHVKVAMTDPAWVESMQEELLQFKRLDVWVLVPAPDNISPLTLKWLFKNKHDEE